MSVLCTELQLKLRLQLARPKESDTVPNSKTPVETPGSSFGHSLLPSLAPDPARLVFTRPYAWNLCETLRTKPPDLGVLGRGGLLQIYYGPDSCGIRRLNIRLTKAFGRGGKAKVPAAKRDRDCTYLCSGGRI